MQLNSRQQEILNLLYEVGKLSVSELACRLYVTEMTIRRDLSAMEKGGFLKRYHGGAVLISSQKEMPSCQPSVAQKMGLTGNISFIIF